MDEFMEGLTEARDIAEELFNYIIDLRDMSPNSKIRNCLNELLDHADDMYEDLTSVGANYMLYTKEEARRLRESTSTADVRRRIREELTNGNTN